ncbi:hypothetical protein Slin14017_G060520 [Septoria linicola]|nr:hypothetical protein Slin14017_G060520 [Septoria linicola]
MSYSPAGSRMNDREYTEDWQTALIKRIYPFWGEKNINLKRSELRYPFSEDNSFFNGHRELYFDRPWQNLIKVKSPAEEMRKQDLKVEKDFRTSVDALGRKEGGLGWRVSVRRAEIVEGLRRRLRDFGEEDEGQEELEEEMRRHGRVLRGLLGDAGKGVR